MQTKNLLLSVLIVLLFTTSTHSWPIPDTGQTKCYDNEKEIPCPKPGEPFYGQDGNYNINPPSYTKLDEKGNDLPDNAETWVMVRDNVTGLIWEVKNAKDGVENYQNPHDSDNKYTWYDSNPETNGGYAGTASDNTDTQDFITALNDASFGGFSDWRIPDIYELSSITDLSKSFLSFNNGAFHSTISDNYWSSTTYATDINCAWMIGFKYGGDDFNSKNLPCYVRAVRGDKSSLFGKLIINDDNTITDLSTGLMWDDKSLNQSWPEALSYCENSKFANFQDWRLPSRKEIRSIASYQRFNKSTIEEVFSRSEPMYFWSSTSLAHYSLYAWFINFNTGKDDAYVKDSFCFFNAVRGGQNQISSHLLISSPHQSTSWETGDIMPIRWDTKDIPGNVRISLSRQGGKTETFEHITETPNNGEFDWLIEGSGSVNCMLKIEPVKAPEKFTQQGLFMITNFVPQNLLSNSHSINVCNLDQTIDIEWAAPEVWGRKIEGYSVQWDYSAETLPEKHITTSALTLTSRTLIESNHHYVHIRVVDDQGHWSNTAAHLGPFCIELLPDIPIPKGLRTSANSKQIEVTWYYMGEKLTYNIYKSDSENGFFIKCDPFEITEPTFIDTDVVEGIQYWYKIKAVNASGEEGFFSDAVSSKIEPFEGGSFQLISHSPYQMQLSGLSATYQIQLIPEGGYSDHIVLSINDLPASFLKATFSNNHISPPGFAILTVNIFNNVPEKQYSFNVSAQGNNCHDEIQLFLDVKDPPSGDSVISAYISHSQVHLHQSFDIYGNLAPRGIKTPISIYVKHGSEQNPTILQTKTDENKSYKTTYTPDQTGQYTIYARWEGDSIFNPSESPIQRLTVYRGKSKLTCKTPDINVSSDNKVRITGNLLLPSIADAQIILKIKHPDDEIEWIKNRIFTEIDGSYSYSVELDQQGIWEISSCWEGNEQYIGSESYPLRLYPGLKAGKALIVAGGGIANNTLWSTIQYLTTQFYKSLLKRHFTQQMIYYISPNINHQNDEIIINDNTPQVSDIETHIKSLYQNVSQPDVNSERPFILYMADHGGSQTFKVNNGLEILKAIDLDSWLDDLQLHTNCPVFVILEACYSGSFVDVLLPSTGQKRVILTSAGGNDQSISDNDGRSSFSRFLFNELSAGNNLYESFDKATAKMENVFLFNKQRPQIEDGNNGEIAKTSYIGGTFLIADIVPEIVDHTPMQTFSAGSHELFMVISDVEGIDRSWISIMPPNFTIPESSNDFETPIINLPKLELTGQGNGRYSAAYEDFTQNGVYHVTFHCEDIGGNVVSEEVLLNVVDGSIPGDLDTNGRITLSDAIISMQSIAGLAVSVSENTRILCNGVVDTCEVIEILQMMAGVE